MKLAPLIMTVVQKTNPSHKRVLCSVIFIFNSVDLFLILGMVFYRLLLINGFLCDKKPLTIQWTRFTLYRMSFSVVKSL